MIEARKLASQKDTILYFSEKVQYVLLLAFAFVSVFSYRLATFVTIALFITWLARTMVRKSDFSRAFTWHNLVFITPILLAFSGLLYTQDLKSGLNQVERLIPVLLFPIFFSSSVSLPTKKKNNILFSYLVACSLAIFICIFKALWANFALNHLSSVHLDLFISHQLASGLQIHPTYLSMYMVLGVIISFTLLKNEIVKRWASILILLFAALASLFVMLLYARTEMIYLVLYLSGVAIYYVTTHSSVRLKSAIIFLALLLPVSFIILSPQFKNKTIARFNQIGDITDSKLIGTNRENGVNQRAFIWKNGLTIVADNPWIGVGTGGYDKAFNMQMARFKASNQDLTASQIAAIDTYVARQFNAHNQYLQIAIQHGLLGLLIFMAVFLLPIYCALKTSNYLYLFFLLLMVFAMLTENVLNRSSGVFLYSFFNAFFAKHFNPGREEKVYQAS